MAVITSFLTLSLMFLFYNTVRDFKTHRVDSRINAIIYGALLMLVFEIHPGLLFLAWGLFSIVVCMLFKKSMGVGDITALRWLFVALGLIDPPLVVLFCIMLIVFMVVTKLSYVWLKAPGSPPGYPAIFGAYLITAIYYFI